MTNTVASQPLRPAQSQTAPGAPRTGYFQRQSGQRQSGERHPGQRQPARDRRQEILVALGALVVALAVVAIGATLMQQANDPQEIAATATSIDPPLATIPSPTLPDPGQTTTGPDTEIAPAGGATSVGAGGSPELSGSPAPAAPAPTTTVAAAGSMPANEPSPEPPVLVAVDPEATTMDLLQANPELSQFTDMLIATGLDSYLDAHDNITVLVPSNDAFTSMEFVDLIRLLNDPVAVETFVRNLLIDEPASLADLASGTEFVSLGGRRVTVDDAGAIIGGAHVVVADVTTGSGMIQVLDRVPASGR